MNYYNENDPKAAAWLRELIAAGLIAPGDVDTRSITEIKPHELAGYTQHHFFAGIGGWSYALRLAGWPDDRPVKTGSCPCQPFSQAGQGKGEQDERHLWPVFRDLIALCEPSVTFGEQVASAAGRVWLARVRADLESLGYGVGAADLCAASVGAPHIRQRLFWVADPDRGQRHGLADGERREPDRTQARWIQGDGEPQCDCSIVGMANTGHESARRGARPREEESGRAFGDASGRCDACGLEHAEGIGREQWRPEPSGGGTTCGCSNVSPWLGNTDNPRPQGRDERGQRANELPAWASSVALPCTDGKQRRIEPGSFPLAHGVSGRVGLLRGYGNAIVPQVAAEFIKAFIES